MSQRKSSFHRQDKSNVQSEFNKLVGMIKSRLAQEPVNILPGKNVMAMESISDDEAVQLSKGVSDLSSTLKNEAIKAGYSGIALESFNFEAGAQAAVIGENPKNFLNHEHRYTEAMESLNDGVNLAANGRSQLAFEAFDETENRNLLAYSVVYNMFSHQDEAAQLFFPEIAIGPDQAGIEVSIRLMEVYSGVKRSISGAINDFTGKNLINAAIDPTILHNDSLRCFPIYRATGDANDTTVNFVDPALVAATDVEWEGKTYHTAPLAVDAQFSLLGISQSDQMLANNGQMDHLDALDSGVQLRAVYLKVPNADGSKVDVLRFDTMGLGRTTFTSSTQGGYREMTLTAPLERLRIGKTTTQNNAGAMVVLKPVVDNDLTVYFNVKMSGQTDLETSTTAVSQTGPVNIAQVIDNTTGNVLAATDPKAAPLYALFTKASIFGYELDARRTNTNLREMDQLLRTTIQTRVYPVRTLSPISTQRSHTQAANGDVDASDLATLLYTTRQRASSAAVAKILETADQLDKYTSATNPGPLPQALGITGLVLPKAFFISDKLDVSTSINLTNSDTFQSNIQAVLVNWMRDAVYRMYTESGWKPMADALRDGNAKPPTVAIMTDPRIARYLMAEGELRTVGADFNVKVAHTYNKNVSGKIFFTLIEEPGDGRTFDPLSFGNMVFRPELTLSLPINKGGSNIKQLFVQPSFRHYVNLPILGVLQVDGLEKLVKDRVPFNFKTV